jgi:hypothetical protein
LFVPGYQRNENARRILGERRQSTGYDASPAAHLSVGIVHATNLRSDQVHTLPTASVQRIVVRQSLTGYEPAEYIGGREFLVVADLVVAVLNDDITAVRVTMIESPVTRAAWRRRRRHATKSVGTDDLG